MIRKLLASACLCSGLITQPVLAEEAIDPEALFSEAMQYRQDGDLFKAIEIFETILSNQPSLNRARLELAVSYHLTRRYEDAKEQMTQVLNDSDTPETVKLSVSAYLAQLAGDIKTASERSTSSIFVSIGGLSDSNINLGPDRDVTNVAPSSIEESGSAGQFMFTYSHRSRANQALHIARQIVDFEWLTQATAYTKAYTSGDSDFNLSVLTLNTGPALIAEESWRGVLNFKVDKLIFGNDDYADYIGINPLFTYSITEDLEITFENTTTSREYDQAADKDLTGTMTTWGIDLAKFYSAEGIGVQGGIKYHDNGARARRLHYTGAEIYLGGQMPAWEDARAYLTISSRDYKYQAAEIDRGFTAKRDETEVIAVLGVSHNFKSGFMKSWTLNAQYAFTDNDSNIDAFAYDRNVFELNLRRYFF